MPYIGNNHIAGDHTNNFKVLDDISSFTATFDGSATSVVDTTNNTIRVVEHRFIQGQRVTYTNGSGGNIGGLTTGTAYFVIFDSASTIKLATSVSNAASNIAINLSAVGSGSSHTLNAAFDGVNTKFKLTHGSGTDARLNNATQINVAINNVVQRPNLDPNNFTDGFALEDNHKIVFQTAPTSEDIFWGSIIANTLTTFDISDHKIDTFTGDGSTTEFTLSHTPANNESLMVTINGVLQHPSNASTARAYTLIASVIQFTAAPGVGDEIQVRHMGFAGASTPGVSGFYGRTGNVVLGSTDNITTGNINAGIVTATTFDGAFTGNIVGNTATFLGNVSVGGVLTYEDVTNVDSVGIITARDGIFLPDNKKLELGNASGSGDLQLYHNTTNSIIKNNTGELELRSNVLKILGNTGAEASVFNRTGSVDLTYNGVKTFETTNQGIKVTGTSINTQVRLATSTGTVRGYLYANNNDEIYVLDAQAHSILRGKKDGTAALYYNNQQKLDTTNTGINITGNVVGDGLTIDGNADLNGDLDVDGHTNLDNVSIAGVSTHADNASVKFGTDGDFSINHSGSSLGMINTTGEILMRNTGGSLYFDCNQISLRISAGSQNMLNAAPSGVTLYTSNDAKLATTNSGVSILKDLDVDGHTNLDNVSISGITTFAQSAGAVTVPAGGDIRIANSGGWSGEYGGKIQQYLNFLYIQGGTSGIRLRHTDGSDRWVIGSSGHFDPGAGGTYDIGNSGNRVREIYANDFKAPDGNGNGLYAGNSDDLHLFHNGADSYIENDTGNLNFTNKNNNNIIFRTTSSETERLRIDSSGNVTVKSSTNNQQPKLRVESYGEYGEIKADGNGSIVIDADPDFNSANSYIGFSVDGSMKSIINADGELLIGDTTATSNSDRLLQIGKTNRSATYLELRTSTSGVGGIVLSDGTSGGNDGYRGTLEYNQSSDFMFFKTAAVERFRINNEGAMSVQTTLTGNAAIAILNNKRTRASGNKYGIEFRDSINEANANIVIQQNSSGNNAAHMSFYINGGTGGNGLENGNHTLRLKQGGDVEIPTGGIEFRTLGSSPAQAAPAFINMGGTHSNAAGNGTNLNAKLKVWSDGTDMMGLSVSSNQLDYIVTQEVYDHVWYGGNSGTTEHMRLEGGGNLNLSNGNKVRINAASHAGTLALLNIGYDGGNNIETRAIDIKGGWSTGESKSITFTHATGSTQMVGQINSVHHGGSPGRTSPHSSLRFGKLYHTTDTSTYTMTLDSTSTTTADLNLKGAYRSTKHPAFSAASSGNNSNLGSTTKMNYIISGTGAANNDGYDTTNHRFVAPVDGFYHFYARHWFTTGKTGTAWLYFYRNGAQVKECRLNITSTTSEYNTMQLSTTLYLNATNYIEVYAAGSGSDQFHPSSGTFHTEFSGFLVC